MRANPACTNGYQSIGPRGGARACRGQREGALHDRQRIRQRMHSVTERRATGRLLAIPVSIYVALPSFGGSVFRMIGASTASDSCSGSARVEAWVSAFKIHKLDTLELEKGTAITSGSNPYRSRHGGDFPLAPRRRHARREMRRKARRWSVSPPLAPQSIPAAKPQWL